MFKLIKTNLAEKANMQENLLYEVIPDTYNLIPFQIYQVGINHPDAWRVFVNPSKPFAFYDGFAKIDRSAEKGCADHASLSLRWAKLKKGTTIDEYMEEIENQYQKKQKKNKKDHFEIISIDPAEGMPHKSYLIHSSIKANHSVYRSFGREETIQSMQLTTYCPVTQRLVIANIASAPEDFERKNSVYKEILFSLTCH